MDDTEFRSTVAQAIRQLADAQEALTAENFAVTTVMSCLLKQLHGSSSELSSLVEAALDEAGEIAVNASGRTQSQHTTKALELIDKIRAAISGHVAPQSEI